MSSKRDQLKKLKQERTTQSIKEMSSPAEDKLNELETYESQEERQNGIPQVVTEEKIEVRNEPETKAETASDTIEKPKKQLKEQTEVQPEAKEAQEALEKKEVQIKVAVEREMANKPEKAKEATKRTSMALLVENNKFIRLRSMQLGMSIQDYVNLLIDEEMEREKSGQADDMGDITENLDMNYRRGQNSTIVALVLKESNAKFLKRGGAMYGMNATTFLNHIISKEQQREKTDGPRRGAFDD